MMNWGFFASRVSDERMTIRGLINRTKLGDLQLSVSTAKRLCRGVYPKRPSATVVRLIEAAGLFPPDPQPSRSEDPLVALYAERCELISIEEGNGAEVARAFREKGAAALHSSLTIHRSQCAALTVRLQNPDAVLAFSDARAAGEVTVSELSGLVVASVLGATTMAGAAIEPGFRQFSAVLEGARLRKERDAAA